MRRFFSCLLLSALCASASAQLNFGINSGVNMSRLELGADAPKVGYAGHFFVEYFGSKKIGVSLGAGYSQRGSAFIQNCGIEPDFTTGYTIPNAESVRTHNLHIPVTAMYRFDLKNNMSLIPHIGAYFSYVFGGQIYHYYGNRRCKFDIPFYDVDQTEEVNGLIASPEEFYKKDLGLTFGLSMQMNKRIRVGIDYDLGLSAATEGMSLRSAQVGRNRNVFVSLGYLFK